MSQSFILSLIKITFDSELSLTSIPIDSIYCIQISYVSSFCQFGGHVETLCLDLEDWNGIENELKTVEPIDLLVNNAGVCVLQATGSVTEEALEKQLSLNSKAIINVSQTLANNWIRDGKKAAIVNISSVSSMRALREHLSYCASKGAVDQITRVMALELGPLVRVNAVNPTIVWTDMGRSLAL